MKNFLKACLLVAVLAAGKTSAAGLVDTTFNSGKLKGTGFVPLGQVAVVQAKPKGKYKFLG